MKSVRRLLGALVFALLLPAVPFVLSGSLFGQAWGQATADRPDYKVGDKWTYHRVDAVADKTDEWSREITEVGPGNHMVVRTESGSADQSDEAMNFAPAGPEDARVLVKYPLKVGNSWTYSAITNPASLAREKGEVKVVAYESISVPAGTFDCYRIDAEATTAARAYKAQRRWSRWYCPAIKWIGKQHLETNIFNPGGVNTRTDETSELTSFSPGK